MKMPSIKHHLSEDLLSGYAAGTLDEAFSLLVASHISLCDECRAYLGALETLGGAVLGDMPAVPMAADSLDKVLARLGAPAPRPVLAPRQGVLPGPVQEYVGGDLAAVRWRPLGMGVRQAILRTAGAAMVRLLYIPAGAAVPDHGHTGRELTLVLQGAFRDEDGRYGVGDVEDANESVEHTPVAEAGLPCICLAVTDAPLRFRSLVPRMLQPFFRI